MNITHLISVLLLLALQINTQFLPERLRIVDSNPTNSAFLVRGNLPINKQKRFQIQQLKGNLTNLTGLNKYKLIVVSLMNYLTPKETKNRYIQEKFFEKHPKEGQYRNRAVLGSLIDPSKLNKWVADVVETVTEFIDFEDLDDLIDQLWKQIHDKNKNVIVYIHCSAGVDRTGYVAGAYKLRHLQYTMQSVIQQNIEVLRGLRKRMHFNTQNGLKWYCLTLGKTQQQCSIPQ